MGQSESLIKKWEGLHKKGKDGLIYAYLCPALVPTIGYGTVVPSLSFGPITESKAEAFLRLDIAKAEASAIRASPVLLRYQDKLDAITSFIYNLGIGRYKASTLRRKINEEDWESSAKEIKRWVWGGGRKLPGLVARRYEESLLLWPS